MTNHEEDVFLQVTASLIAAISLLEKYHANCAPTKRDALYSTKLGDYNKSAEAARSLIQSRKSRFQD